MRRFRRCKRFVDGRCGDVERDRHRLQPLDVLAAIHSRQVPVVVIAPANESLIARNIRFIVDKLIDPQRHNYKIEWIYGYDVTR